MPNSLYHAIAKCLAEKLEPLQRQLAPRSYRDTFEFIDDIKDLNVNGLVMFSLDVSSLFTNVPVTETVDYICDFLSASQQEIGIPAKTLKELLLRCTLTVQFLFDNQIYRQVDGVAMGSPFGPFLADVYMGKLERFQLSNQIDKLKHYGRCVDDIFAIATAETDVATLLDAANQAHPSIKFTLEIETDINSPISPPATSANSPIIQLAKINTSETTATTGASRYHASNALSPSITANHITPATSTAATTTTTISHTLATDENTLDFPLTVTLTITGNMDSIPACAHRGGIFTIRIGLVHHS
nr:unnamed protein product [Spirometra erinaceieuropaei]